MTSLPKSIRPASSRRSLVAAASLAIGLASCGYTEQEWQVQTDKYQRAITKQRAAEEKLDQLSNDLEAEHTKTSDLEERLRGMGVDIDSKDAALTDLNSTLADRERALAEYKLRTKQLEQIKARFEALRVRLDELTKLGIEVKVRKNRMVISLPGDVLFDSGKDRLKKEGKEILLKVSAVIHDDPGLAGRDYQVAGHTDSKALTGGNFGDNWGLSVMRARQVLLLAIDPQQGKLPAAHWSAAGYADTDPVAPNDTDEGRQANRRCDIVVVPSAEELIDLRALAGASAARAPVAPAVAPAPTGADDEAQPKKPAKPAKAPAPKTDPKKGAKHPADPAPPAPKK